MQELATRVVQTLDDCIMLFLNDKEAKIKYQGDITINITLEQEQYNISIEIGQDKLEISTQNKENAFSYIFKLCYKEEQQYFHPITFSEQQQPSGRGQQKNNGSTFTHNIPEVGKQDMKPQIQFQPGTAGNQLGYNNQYWKSQRQINKYDPIRPNITDPTRPFSQFQGTFNSK